MVRGEKGGALNHRMRMNEGNLTQSCEDSSSAMIVNPLCQLQLHAFGSPGAKLPRDDARSLGDGSWGTTRVKIVTRLTELLAWLEVNMNFCHMSIPTKPEVRYIYIYRIYIYGYTNMVWYTNPIW